MASKKESTFVTMVLTLFIVTFVASAALGYLYELTKGPIEASKLAKLNNAITQVVPEFDTVPQSAIYKKGVDGDTLIFYPAMKDTILVGTAVKTFTNNGFSGYIGLMVGFLPDGTIHNISVLEHKETPGLGDKMQKSKSQWSVQFNGKNPADFQLLVTKDGGDVDAITASTISSRAFCDAVQRAYNAYMEGGKQ